MFVWLCVNLYDQPDWKMLIFINHDRAMAYHCNGFDPSSIIIFWNQHFFHHNFHEKFQILYPNLEMGGWWSIFRCQSFGKQNRSEWGRGIFDVEKGLVQTVRYICLCLCLCLCVFVFEWGRSICLGKPSGISSNSQTVVSPSVLGFLSFSRKKPRKLEL